MRVRQPLPNQRLSVLDNLERRFGRFAIPNVTLILIMGQVLVFVMSKLNPPGFEKILLYPEKVMDGEVHRLITFLFQPLETSPIWAFFAWYLFYLMGTALEHFLGTFRYNVFLLIGYVATVIAGFAFGSPFISNKFVEGTVFLAFAHLNPRFELRLFFVLAVQIRWLAMIMWIGYVLSFLGADLPQQMVIGASVLNYFIFFGPDIARRMFSGHRFMKNQASRFAMSNPSYYHKCSVCGITDADDPKMEFRYCSKCSGDHAYCQEHLRNHVCVVGEETED